MFAALQRDEGTAAELARVLAAWLVIVLLLQAFAALHTLVRGPAHRHPPVLFGAPAAADADAHLDPLPHRHSSSRSSSHLEAHRQGDTSHHHLPGEVSVLTTGADAALDTAACVLLALLLPLAARWSWSAGATGVSPSQAARRTFADHCPAPPRPPPRR